MSVGRRFLSPAALLYWALVLMTMLNLGGILYLTQARTASPEGQGKIAWVVIGLCAIVLALTARTPVRKSLGLPGLLFLCAVSSYLGIGIAVNMWKTTNPFPLVPFLRHSVYLMVVVATAVATPTIARRIGSSRLLLGLLVVLTAGCASVFLTPLILTSNIYASFFNLRNFGLYMQPNQAGRFAVMTTWLALALILCNRNRKLACFALAIAVSAIFASASRSAIIVLGALAVLFAAYWIVLRPKIATGAISLLIFAAAVGGIAMLAWSSPAILASALVLPQKVSTLLELLSGNIQMVTRDMRWDVLMQTLQSIEAAPLVGSGFSETHSVEGGRICGERLDEFIWCGPHNLYLMLWREAGVVPVSLYLGYVFSTLGMSLTLPQRAVAVTALGWTVANAFQNLFSDNGFEMLWMGSFTGLTFGLLMHEMHQSPDS